MTTVVIEMPRRSIEPGIIQLLAWYTPCTTHGMRNSHAGANGWESRGATRRLAEPLRTPVSALRTREALRTAARRLDESREGVDPGVSDRASRLCEDLLRGRWTLVDWFDIGGRRFIIARRSTPQPGLRSGLTERERRVALCAARGESNKITGYRLGIGPPQVSAHLKAAMRKLGVRSKAQLVVMVRLLNRQPQDRTLAPVRLPRRGEHGVPEVTFDGHALVL